MKKKYFILLILLFLKGDSICMFYKNIIEITNPEEISTLVNKNYRLPQDYTPNDLALISPTFSKGEKYLRKEAKQAFEKLGADASEKGYTIRLSSGFRSYEYQKILYTYYVNHNGKEYADLCSARPGHSEHQTGLSFDVEGSLYDYNRFEETKEFLWIKENAHRYGFILRYPKGKEKITGFKYEPWHYRYVGKEIAGIIKENNLTLEEYLSQT